MIFSLTGSALKDATYTSTTVTKNNETVTSLNDSVGDNLAVSGYRNVACSVFAVQNITSGATVPANNYSMTNCLIKGTSGGYMGSNVNVSYTFTYDDDNTGTTAINDTITSIGGVTEWFDIFVVIGAMVVLILLTVIIITAIRGSGMIQGENTGYNKNVGTA